MWYHIRRIPLYLIKVVIFIEILLTALNVLLLAAALVGDLGRFLISTNYTIGGMASMLSTASTASTASIQSKMDKRGRYNYPDVDQLSLSTTLLGASKGTLSYISQDIGNRVMWIVVNAVGIYITYHAVDLGGGWRTTAVHFITRFQLEIAESFVDPTAGLDEALITLTAQARFPFLAWWMIQHGGNVVVINLAVALLRFVLGYVLWLDLFWGVVQAVYVPIRAVWRRVWPSD